jgi:hypothetical protein
VTRRRELVGVALLFALLGLLFTYPLVRHLAAGIPYVRFPAPGAELKWMEPGDSLQLYYWFWLMKDNLTGGSPLFTNPYEFDVTPVLPPQRYGFYQFPLSLLFVAFSPLGGAVAYNLMVLLSFPLAAVAMYLLARLYTDRPAGAVLAAAIFALVPFRLGQLLGGHSNGFLFFLFPLTLYGYERALAERRARWGVLAGGCLVALALTDFHLLYYLVLFSAAFWAVRVAAIARGRPGWRAGAAAVGPALAPVAVAGVVCVAYVLAIKSTVMGGSLTATGGRPYALIARNAPRLADLLVARNPDDERAVYLGLIPLALGAVGWLAPGGRRPLRLYGIGFVAAWLLALGPTLDAWAPLYRLLYLYLPYWNYPRSPGRLMILASLSLAVLAAHAAWALPRGRAWTRVTVAGLLAGIAVEYAPFRAAGITLLDFANPLYRTVAREAGDGRFLAVPLFPGDSHQSSVYEFHVTTTRAHTVNGYNPLVSREYVQEIFDRLVNLNLGEIRPGEHELLRALRVRFLVVHEDLFFWKVSPFPGALTVENLAASPYLTPRGRHRDLALFELRTDPVAAPPRFDRSSPVGAVHEAEELARRTGRAAADPEASGGHAVVAEEGRDAAGYLTFGVAPFYPTGRYVAGFRLKLDGAIPPGGVAVVDVAAERGRRLLARREVSAADFARPGRYEDIDVPWAVEAPSRVEFRVYYQGRGRLLADRVYVTFRDRTAPAPFYEAEDLLRQSAAQVAADAGASGGLAVHAPAGRPATYPVFGPYRRYPAGRYEARFRLRLDAGAPAVPDAAVVDVSTDRGLRQLGARAVAARDVGGDGYREVPVPFDLEAPAVLEFRVFHPGTAGLWIDRVDIRPLAEAAGR